MDKLCYVVWYWENTKCDQCHRMKEFIQKHDGANAFQDLYHLLQKKKKTRMKWFKFSLSSHSPSPAGNICLQNRTCLQSTVRICSKIIGLLVRALRTALRILQDPSHALFPAFEWLPSGCHCHSSCPGCRATFVCKAVQLPHFHPQQTDDK